MGGPGGRGCATQNTIGANFLAPKQLTNQPFSKHAVITEIQSTTPATITISCIDDNGQLRERNFVTLPITVGAALFALWPLLSCPLHLLALRLKIKADEDSDREPKLALNSTAPLSPAHATHAPHPTYPPHPPHPSVSAHTPH